MQLKQKVEPRPGDPVITPALIAEHGLTTDEYQRVVEMLGCERCELIEQRGVPHDRGEQVALSLDARLEQPWRRRRRRASGPPRSRRSEARERLSREIEPVGDEPARLLALR